MKKEILTANQQGSSSTPAVLPMNSSTSLPAPSSFFARVQRLFSSKSIEQDTPFNTELFLDTEDFFEYHNPTLGLQGFGTEG